MKRISGTPLILVTLVLVMWISGCQDEKQSEVISPWTEIIIKLEGQRIEIFNDAGRSAFNRIYLPKDTIEKVSFSRSQLDSVHNYINSIIESAPVTNRVVDVPQAANISFEIVLSKEVARHAATITTRKIEFQYITTWKTLSPETKELSNLLARNMRLVK